MYCPDGVICTDGGATLVHMNTYICKGGGSNMYCENIDSSIETCPNGETKCASLIWGALHYSMTCKNGNIYTRPKCPYYYQEPML